MSRPGDRARGLRRLDAEIAAARLANGGDARRERALHPLGGEIEVQRERRVHGRHRVEITVGHEVHVAVDEAGVHGMAGRVDRVVAVESGADVDDAVALDHDVGHRRGATDAVEHLAAADRRGVEARCWSSPHARPTHRTVSAEMRVDALWQPGGVPAEQGDRLPAGEPVGHAADVCDRVVQRVGAAGVDPVDVGQQLSG